MNSSIPEADTDSTSPAAAVLSYAAIIRIFMRDHSLSKPLPDLPFTATLLNLDRLQSLCLILQDQIQVDHRYIGWLQELQIDCAALTDSKYMETCVAHRNIMYGLMEENHQLQRSIAHDILLRAGVPCDIVPSPMQNQSILDVGDIELASIQSDSQSSTMCNMSACSEINPSAVPQSTANSESNDESHLIPN